jgi:PAS domain-containing protein
LNSLTSGAEDSSAAFRRALNMIDSENILTDAYELLIQGVVDYAIYMLDPTGHVVSWNPGAERIKGYTADELSAPIFRASTPMKIVRPAFQRMR